MPVNLQLAASCLKDMPSGHPAAAHPHLQAFQSNASRRLPISSRPNPEPEVSEWSGLLVNEQEVAIHPVQAVDVCMASSSNSIELTPLWPKGGSTGSPSHGNGLRNGGSGGGGNSGWPADHKSVSNGKAGQRAPPPPPPPTLGPPAVPTKSKNQPPPPPPPLPLTSSKEFMQRKQQQQELLAAAAANRRHHAEAGLGSENKGPAPQPPQIQPVPPVTIQPLR